MLQYEGIKLNSSNLIGKGSFTKAYRNKNTVYVVSHCPAKEAIALFADQSNKHIPTIERLDYCIDDKGNSIYKMPYYARINKGTYPKAWKQYKAVKNIIDSAQGWDIQGEPCEWLELIENAKSIPKKLRDAIINLIECLMNYTDTLNLEISPRNVGVNSKGELVLLDIIFDVNTLHKVHSTKGGH